MFILLYTGEQVTAAVPVGEEAYLWLMACIMLRGPATGRGDTGGTTSWFTANEQHRYYT